MSATASPPTGSHVIGVLAESANDERRVALVPRMVQRLTRRGVRVVVAEGAGEAAFISDDAFTEAGAEVGDPFQADVLVCVGPPSDADVEAMQSGSVLVGFLAPAADPQRSELLERAGVTGFAMESIPRISRAQSMDALSSQANVAGYRSALIAATELARFFPMLTTSAGTMKPAETLVLGVGVAGLQALATARRLGSKTTGYDVRPEVADQVRSVGAQWLDLGIEAVGEGGYARELSAEERTEQQRRLTEAIKGFDVVITTAQVPGRKAPVLVSREAAGGMRPGSVIVDLAGESGGNCELTEPGEFITVEGIRVCSPLNLAAQMPDHASELYARNVTELLELLLDSEGNLHLDADDAIVDGACVTGRQALTSAQRTDSGDADPGDADSGATNEEEG